MNQITLDRPVGQVAIPQCPICDGDLTISQPFASDPEFLSGACLSCRSLYRVLYVSGFPILSQAH